MLYQAMQPGSQAARQPGSQAARQPGSQAASQPPSKWWVFTEPGALIGKLHPHSPQLLISCPPHVMSLELCSIMDVLRIYWSQCKLFRYKCMTCLKLLSCVSPTKTNHVAVRRLPGPGLILRGRGSSCVSNQSPGLCENPHIRGWLAACLAAWLPGCLAGLVKHGQSMHVYNGSQRIFRRQPSSEKGRVSAKELPYTEHTGPNNTLFRDRRIQRHPPNFFSHNLEADSKRFFSFHVMHKLHKARHKTSNTLQDSKRFFSFHKCTTSTKHRTLCKDCVTHTNKRTPS